MTLLLPDLELELVDEPRCGSNHGNNIQHWMLEYYPKGLPDGFPCSIKVVGRKQTCLYDFFICQVSYDWNMAVLANNPSNPWGNVPCLDCGAPWTSCWRIFLI